MVRWYAVVDEHMRRGAQPCRPGCDRTRSCWRMCPGLSPRDPRCPAGDAAPRMMQARACTCRWPAA